MQLLFDGGVRKGRITLNRWVEITSTAAAKMFGLFPRKGTIAPGSDADIVIWDPEKEYMISVQTHHMAVDYSMYEGKKVKGNTDVVISRGEVIMENEKFSGKPGRGNFIKRDTHGTAWN
jgi:dihydropyrimidinase